LVAYYSLQFCGAFVPNYGSKYDAVLHEVHTIDRFAPAVNSIEKKSLVGDTITMLLQWRHRV